MRQAVEVALAGSGVELIEAGSCAEAERITATSHFALALIDHSLPDGSGYELAARLRKRWPSLVVVILSSRHAPFDRMRAEEAGVSHFVDKPFQTDQLAELVQNLLAASHLYTSPDDAGDIASTTQVPGTVIVRKASAEEGPPLAGSMPAPAPPAAMPVPAAAPPRMVGMPDPAQPAAAPPSPVAPPQASYELETAYAAAGSDESFSEEFLDEDVELGESPPVPEVYVVAGNGGTPPRLPPLPLARSSSAISGGGDGGGGDEGGGGDGVDCSLFCPREPMVGDRFIVQVFVHRPTQRDAAEAEAKIVDIQAVHRGRKRLRLQIVAGTTLQIELQARDLIIENRVDDLIWTGEPESVQFEVMVPWHHPGGTSALTVFVSVAGIPLGTIKGHVVVRSGATVDGSRLQPVHGGEHAVRFETAFVSYASPDRSEVLRRVQMLRALGVKCSQDVIDLAPGDRWQKALYQLIDDCDLFLLFWSTAAKESDWVLREARYALARQIADKLARPEIRPILLEGPPVPDPPPELAHLHFNDFLVYMIDKQVPVAATPRPKR